MRATVVGAGVVGLSCAVRLAEAGHRVRVVAREAPADTTSAVAAAVWFPYLAAPRARVHGWAIATYRELTALAERAPESGVVMRDLLSLATSDAALELPEWRAEVEGFRAALASELPPAALAGWVARVPVVETPRYLPWLEARALAAGMAIEIRRGGLAALDEVAATSDVVVHCSGLGARALAGDATMTPVRGQVARVRAPDVRRVVLVDDAPPGTLSQGPVYVIPRRDDCVVGGTAEPLAADTPVDASTCTPDPALTGELLARAAPFVPEIAHALVLGARVGLRPARPAVRLELERRAAGPPIVHCYGHGGSGYTLAWACADEALALATAAAS